MILWIFKVRTPGQSWEVSPIVDILIGDERDPDAHAQHLADTFGVEVRMHNTSKLGTSSGFYFHPIAQEQNDDNTIATV